MKKILLLSFLALGVCKVNGQLSPYSLSPDWYFGQGGRLTFPGDYPTSAAPTAGYDGANTSTGVEASTSVCFPNRSVAVFTNSQQAYNGSAAAWTDYIRSFTADNTCAGSSTGAAVAIPDPQSPTNAFYIILANDVTSGSCNHAGVNRYRFTGTGTTVAYNAGPTLMAPDAFAGEAITASTDGNGGYWVIIHNKASTNTFRVWHFTSTGITGPTDYTIGAAVSDVSSSQSYLKVSPCQDKIAYHSGGILVVNNWNRTTGVVGSEIRRITPANYGVGLEFSPDGSKIFYSGQASIVSILDIASGSIGSVAGSSSWSMQLGNDGNIYASPGGSSLGVISSPNSSPSYSTLALPGGGSTFRGLSNIAWLSPQSPVVTPAATATCNRYNFSFAFQNYFNNNVAVNVSSITWDWGDGSSNTTNNATPTHDFPTTGGPYTVTLTFNDATCGHTWTASTPVTISCPAPVEWLSFTGTGTSSGVDLLWQTATELNNDYFEVQRSFDGKEFSGIGHVKGAGSGTKSTVSTYPFHDGEVTSGVVYYRLIQHDIDGKQSTSKTIAVRLQGSNGIPVLVAPNPFSSTFVVSKMYSEAATMSIYDIYGRLLEQKVTTSGEASVSLGEGLANGSYILQYSTSSGVYSLRIEKK